ncbi:MAG: TSUP family transporter [Bacteroidota bacterium]|nr:TSUP family transporter [Bacteroidota bacterium]
MGSKFSISEPVITEEISGGNNLFPVFLKLEELSLLIIGGGNVAFEKLNAVLNNSPQTKIKLVGIEISNAIKDIAEEKDTIELLERAYTVKDIEEADIVIAAVNDLTISEQIKNDTKEKGKLVNVADKPGLCDFYLGSIVKKGNIKIAISTNGKSPTIAKRLKEVINNFIPDEMEDVLKNMGTIRAGMNGDFDEKVKHLNDITKVLVAKQTTLAKVPKSETKKWQKIVTWCLLAFFFMILGHTVLSYIPLEKIIDGAKKIPSIVDKKSFLMMMLCGFLAQMADGSLGMGYGTISTTFLLANGVNPAIVSSRVHSARVFSSGVSGYSHHRFGNFNKKLFKALVIPGVVGAIIGAALAFYAQKYSNYVRIPVSLYTVYLGFFIIRKAFKKQNLNDKVKRAGWLATAGGFMDAFAGGGWGSLVTSTLISKRKSPRYVVGSVCLAEFFVVLASSITFFIFLKSIPLFDVAGLIIGGLIAAPIAAKFVGKVPLKTMFILVGSLVILTSFSTLWRGFAQLMLAH